LEIAICSGRTVTLMFIRMERRWNSPRNPPSAPGEAAISAADLPTNPSSRGSSFDAGRDTQSIVFLSAAVTDELYSGAEIKNP